MTILKIRKKNKTSNNPNKKDNMTLQQLNQQYSIKELIPLYNYKNQERFENILFISFNKINQKINLKIKELKQKNKKRRMFFPFL